MNGPSSPKERIACVSFETRRGHFRHTTMGNTPMEVAAKAMDFFLSDFWSGPKPHSMTLLTITLVGDDRTWRILGEKVLQRQAKQKDGQNN